MPVWSEVGSLVILIVVMVFYFLSALTNPGYITNSNIDFQDMLNVIESTQLCPDCHTIRTTRSRHCSICGHCIERFDHHCPWINNCVGLKNHNYFLGYIVTQGVLLLYVMVLIIYAIVEIAQMSDDKMSHKFAFY